MEVFIAIVGGFILTFTTYLIVLFRLSRKKRMELIDWFLLSMSTFNGVVFGFVMWSTHAGRNLYIYSDSIMNIDSAMSLIYFILSIIFLVCVVFGWYLVRNRNKFLGSKYKIKLSRKCSEQFILQRMISIGWVMLFIAIVSYWLYTRAYGGFIGLLNFSRAIRSGVFENENKFSFLQRFGGFSFFSSYIFYALLIDKENKIKKKKKIFFGFFFSLSFSLYVLYSWVGRVSLALYLATFALGYILYSYNSIGNFVRKVFFLSISIFFLLIFTDGILGRSGANIGIIELFSKELSFPLSTFYHVLDLSEYRWFKDIIVAPLYLLPSRIWSGLFNIETASSFNTFLIAGAHKGENGVFGEIPVDMISFSFMQGNIIGIIIIGLIWGTTLHIVECLINKIPIKSVRSIINANLIFNLGIMSALYGDPQHILVGSFNMIIGFIMIWLFLKVGVGKNKNNM